MDIQVFCKELRKKCYAKIYLEFPDIDSDVLEKSYSESSSYIKVLSMILSCPDGQIDERRAQRLIDGYCPHILSEVRLELTGKIDELATFVLGDVKQGLKKDILRKYGGVSSEKVDGFLSQSAIYSKMWSFARKRQFRSFTYSNMFNELNELFFEGIAQEVSEMIEKNGKEN